jgi:hypothetical protein
MAMLGIPLEERKKAYAGKTMQDLVQDYQKAERSRDLPTMIALLDIIRTAPKPKAGPKTTVVQDTMAALMPQPAMATPGIDGAVDAMAAQNAPQQLDMPAVMAADGGLMDSGEKPARFFLGGQGTVAPYSSFAGLSVDDLERMALMGDPDAQKELNTRLRANIRPPVTPGPGIGVTTPQVTDQFRTSVRPTATLGVAPPSAPMGPAQVFPTQTSIPTGTGTTPIAATSPAMGAPQAFPGQNVPRLGIPGVTPGTAPTPSAAAPTAVPTTPAAPATPPTGIRGLINRVSNSPVGRFAGYATKGLGIAELLRPTEANVGEDDMLAKTRMLESMGSSLNPSVKAAAQADALQPRISLIEWKAKYFPEAAAQDLAPGAPKGSDDRGMAMPVFPINLADYKDKSIEDYITERNQYEAKLGTEKGVRSIKDIQADLEKFRTEGKERAAADKAAAKEAFQQDALLAAGLAAPQLLKGRGLAQAFARFSEKATPGLMGAAQAQKAAIKEATKSEREAADKFKLAQLDLDKSYRAEELGKFDKAAALRSDGIKTYIQASLEKYKSDVYAAVNNNYISRIAAKGLIEAAGERIKRLENNPQFKNLPLESQQRLIQSIMSGAINQGSSQRPKILDVPGQ